MNNVYVVNNQLVIEGFYSDERHIEKPYTHGIYGMLPGKQVPNYLKKEGSPGRNADWPTFMYNNTYQYHTEKGWVFTHGRREERILGYLDKSGANRGKVVGSMKEIFKNFETEYLSMNIPAEEIDINELEEEFWAYYINNYGEEYKNGCKTIENYVDGRRKMLNETEKREERNAKIPEIIKNNDDFWVEHAHDFLRHLIYITPSGFLAELILFQALKELTGGEFIESDKEAEKQGIDGWIEYEDRGRKYTIPVCLKPESYRRMAKSRTVSPINEDCLVYYNKYDGEHDDLVFTFETFKEFPQIALSLQEERERKERAERNRRNRER